MDIVMKKLNNSLKKNKYKKIITLTCLAMSIGVLGIFSALMIAALYWSKEDTILKMTVTIPAWMLIAFCAFVGMTAAFAGLRHYENQVTKREERRGFHAVEKKIDALIVLAQKMNTERTQLHLEPDEGEESLPYENMDDLFDCVNEISDQEAEDLAKQLLTSDCGNEQNKSKPVGTRSSEKIVSFRHTKKRRKKQRRK